MSLTNLSVALIKRFSNNLEADMVRGAVSLNEFFYQAVLIIEDEIRAAAAAVAKKAARREVERAGLAKMVARRKAKEAEHLDYLESVYAAAEEATRGSLVSAAGAARGIRSWDVVVGRVSPKWATQELASWLRENRPLTLKEWLSGLRFPYRWETQLVAAINGQVA